jgi:hypothetical protein
MITGGWFCGCPGLPPFCRCYTLPFFFGESNAKDHMLICFDWLLEQGLQEDKVFSYFESECVDNSGWYPIAVVVALSFSALNTFYHHKKHKEFLASVGSSDDLSGLLEKRMDDIGWYRNFLVVLLSGIGFFTSLYGRAETQNIAVQAMQALPSYGSETMHQALMSLDTHVFAINNGLPSYIISGLGAAGTAAYLLLQGVEGLRESAITKININRVTRRSSHTEDETRDR